MTLYCCHGNGEKFIYLLMLYSLDMYFSNLVIGQVQISLLIPC